MHRDYEKQLRNYHQAKWNEELIFDLSVPGERGVLVTPADASVIQEVGSGLDTIPASLKRKKVPNLPEVNQVRANRHFMRLSQETLSVDTTPDFEGTCTMKYSPKVQEHMVARNPKFTEVHPLQPDETKQGLLEIYYETEQMLKAISGMDAFSLQPGGGATAVFAAACVIRAYHESRGEGYRDEIVTTIFSHPCDAAGPATAGYKVITLMIDPEKGYPSLEDMKAALSERTAAIFITNPEDTGIYNPDIKEYVEAAHEVGAICYYDQANANGMLGIARAKEVGFDAIHYNLHKTFSAPHGGLGPGCGALGVIKDLEPFLPSPRILKEGEKFVLQVNNPQSIGHTRQFFGNSAAVLRAYMWIRTLGAEGVREAAICSVLNNQYLMKKMEQIHGVDIWYAKGKRRLEQCRYSFETLKKETGFGTDDLNHRVMDFGLEEAFLSHHPYIVPEPLTLEPCESCSRDDIDEYVSVYTEMCREAYEEPELLRNAPHNCAIHRMKVENTEKWEELGTTLMQYEKRRKE